MALEKDAVALEDNATAFVIDVECDGEWGFSLARIPRIS